MEARRQKNCNKKVNFYFFMKNDEFGVIFLNSILFAVGHAVLGGYQEALILLLVGISSGWLTLKYVDSLKTQEVDENS